MELDITSADLLETLGPIWHAQPETARRVRQRISAVMEWAIAMQYRTDNPCDRIRPALGRQRILVRHMWALPFAPCQGGLGDRDGADVEGDACGQARVRVLGADGGAVGRRGGWRALPVSLRAVVSQFESSSPTISSSFQT